MPNITEDENENQTMSLNQK